MKKLTIIALFLTGMSGFAQVTKNVGDFDKVTSFDRIDVTLVPSTENKIVITGKDADKVEIVNKSGELKIRMPINRILDGDDISATLYYTKIEAVEANEGSRIASEATFKATSFDIVAKEGSEIKINLDVDKLKLKASQGSKVYLTGSADNQDVLVNSGAIYEGEQLETNQTAITVNAGGEVKINVKNLADAKVRAGGDILIYGHPKQINKKIIAGGTIEEAK